MGPAEAAHAIRVEVVWVPVPHDVRRIQLRLPAGATAREALQASGLLAEFPGLVDAAMGVWGRNCDGDQPLRDLDRVELYRPLTVDPKEARRLRHRRTPALGGGAAARMKA
jgi:putative ubiquitin-RnfH superfamily antitoxin RatB of RatAB toxin-antitoxin module